MANVVFTLLENDTVDVVSPPFVLDSNVFTVYVSGLLDGGVVRLEASPEVDPNSASWYPVIGGAFSETKKGSPVDYVSTFDDNVMMVRAVLAGAGVNANVTMKAVIKVK